MEARAGIVSLLFLIAAATAVTLPGTASAAQPANLSGVVQSGGTASARPLAGVKVTLYEASNASPRVVGTAMTDATGRFTVTAPTDEAVGVFYASAAVGRGVEFAAVLGTTLPATATVNELTTVAAGYSMAQFYQGSEISGDPFALQLAAGMNDNIVDPATGASSPVLLTSPNADETISLRSTRALANLLAACVVSRGTTAKFLAMTKPQRGRPARSTVQAVANLARNPGRKVDQIYRLTKRARAYEPALERGPDAWTVAVKVNDSGSDAQDELFGGPGNLAFDAWGFAWVTNNVVQGGPTSSSVVMVLQPNGKPADGANGTPLSPLTGGGILGTGYGVTIDPLGNAWFGNFGWGGEAFQPQPGVDGSMSEFSPAGIPLSGPKGYVNAVDRAQGLASDDGNIWITSFGSDSVIVFLGGDPSNAVSYRQYRGSQPFDVALAPDGGAWVSNSGGLGGEFPSSIARFELVGDELKRTTLRFVGSSLKGLSVDSRGNAWVSSLDDDSVYGIRPDGSLIGQFTGGGIIGPWDVTVDGDDNLWVSNFGPVAVTNNFPDGRLSKLCGIERAACPPGAKTGDPITPSTGYTLPSAGSEVLLANGDPLYGAGEPPSFSPMMRQTASVIDRAGNLWTINNWKPDFIVDATSNPGGDGVVIFVGLAPPPVRAD
ncbi:MAG: hypothetical protein U9Q81_06300 [Pseudomonadota bacterium]|nr:hypothetical protein [Pseudomonadota bacterium]